MFNFFFQLIEQPKCLAAGPSLLMKTITGVFRILQTLREFLVCISTPFNNNHNQNNAVNGGKCSVRLPQSLFVAMYPVGWCGYSGIQKNHDWGGRRKYPCRSISIKSEVAPFLFYLDFTAPAVLWLPRKVKQLRQGRFSSIRVADDGKVPCLLISVVLPISSKEAKIQKTGGMESF